MQRRGQRFSVQEMGSKKELLRTLEPILKMIYHMSKRWVFSGGEAPVEGLSEWGLVGWVTGIARRSP